jgi:hypothetical protein
MVGCVDAGVAYVARFTGGRADACPVEALNRRVRHRKVRKAEQDRSIQVEDLTEVVMGGGVSGRPSSDWYHLKLRRTSPTPMMVHVRLMRSLLIRSLAPREAAVTTCRRRCDQNCNDIPRTG